jgi:hypothetical protein
MTLPQPDVPKFSGDPTDFHTFMMAFDTRIASRTANKADLLYYLDQHLEGEAKEIMGGCLHMDPNLGYVEARTILNKEYGDPYKISIAYVDKVLSWPMIKQDDNVGLKRFGIFLIRCLKAMQNLPNMDVLNHLPNLQVIVSKLPTYIQNKWRDHANRIRHVEHRMVIFNDITHFVQTAYESANDPVFSRTALNKLTQPSVPFDRKAYNRSKPGIKAKSTSFAVSVDSSSHTKDSTSGIRTPPTTAKQHCYFCGRSHDIDNCFSFLKKSMAERRSFLREKNMCVACFGSNTHLGGVW